MSKSSKSSKKYMVPPDRSEVIVKFNIKDFFVDDFSRPDCFGQRSRLNLTYQYVAYTVSTVDAMFTTALLEN